MRKVQIRKAKPCAYMIEAKPQSLHIPTTSLVYINLRKDGPCETCCYSRNRARKKSEAECKKY